MDKDSSYPTTPTVASTEDSKKKGSKEESVKTEEPKKKARGHCSTSVSSSHTQYFRKDRHEDVIRRITENQYLNISESISTTATFGCVGKQYTKEGLLKRNFLKKLDPIPLDRKWNDECAPSYDWEMAKKLEFLVQDETAPKQLDRLQAHLRDLARTSSYGYRVDVLPSITIIVDYLVETVHKLPVLKEGLELLLRNLMKPILLNANSDVITYFENISDFIGFMGYLLMRVEEDHLFDLVSMALTWHLSAPDKARGKGALQLRHTLSAASILTQVVSRMIAIASPYKFPTFMNLALLLACDTVDNCLEMMKENIIENIFYRFNPDFPEDLPVYSLNPADCQDLNVKLGASSVHISTTLSLLLVLAKTTKEYLEKNPKYALLLPCPDFESLRYFVWGYRYEVRAKEHRHQRCTLTVIAATLIKCFGNRLTGMSSMLMPDIIALAVFTEVPPNYKWLRTVEFNTMQQDVLYKKVLICFVVDLLKVFPYNKYMVISEHWLLGLMYLLDPGLCHLRARWSPPHFAEIRKVALQALVCTLHHSDPSVVREYALVRRILWYIEWYSESPYEISTLYWCVRLLQAAVYQRKSVVRETSIQDLFDTHGIIILLLPPVEKCQAVMSLCLRLLTSSSHTQIDRRLSCCVYPNIKWPKSVNTIARKMLDVVLYSLEKHYIVSDRWMISLLNFIWEAVIWRQQNREQFIANNGIYKLLDIIAMTRSPVQCIALAILCDVARAGDAVGQLTTWRANFGAANANSPIVKRGATIASLLAAIFRDGCIKAGVKLSHDGVLQDLLCPIRTTIAKETVGSQDIEYSMSHRTRVCVTAGEMAGSRMSKTFSLLHLLSEDLENKVALADEAYNLYKNIKLDVKDEAVLVLCSHYLTLKLNEAWTETHTQSPGLVHQDSVILDEFLNIGMGWAKEIQRQQEDVIERERKKDTDEENSLYAFLGRIRLNIALDALKTVRCVARSADRHRFTHALLHDAVYAHHRRSVFTKRHEAQVLRTFKPPFDDANITGQNVKVYSIQSKNQPYLADVSTTSEHQSSE
ncbi:cilia- and flagella-associated protein 69-like isoform X2 [Anticarsia gemmatalis]|uniref:cilia- and flagella-associated protein 69-like isoform X2 n=1 Tax=Anticarsia gemmatalis TaxID=129554 RepID=UPI003F76E1D5